MLHRIKLFLLLIIIFSSATVSAQEAEPWEIGLGIGYTNYYGDLSPYKIDGLRNLYRIADFNRHYQDRPSFSLMLHRKLTPTLGFMLQANYLQFGMSDRYINKSGNIDSSAGNYARALNFQTSVKDIGLAFTFNANNGKVFAKDAFFYPSFYLGAGVSQFTVKGDLYDANNNAYNYRLPGNINDGSFETNLRDLRTETDSKYADVVPYVNLGLALNFRFSRRFSLAVQTDLKYSASDYLDDVSRLYKASYPVPAEAYAARPGYNTVNPVTLARGDNDGLNDFYINNRVVLHVGLGGRPKPAPFAAPVIYTLAPPLRIKKAIDSVRIKATADSISKVKADSMLRAKVDSVKIIQDSLVTSSNAMRISDSATKAQLQAMNAELTELRTIISSQQSQPELKSIEVRADSIRSMRQKLASQKKLSQEDNLRLRIYDFELDSLNRESDKIRVRTNTSQGKTTRDSAEVTDSKEIREYSEEVSTLKKDERYKTDTAFRKNVDVLQTRLDRYREQAKQDAAAEKARAKNNNQRIDSLQSRIRELESAKPREDRSDRVIEKRDTVFTSAPVKKDTVTRRRYEPTVTEIAPDTVAVKKKWYQRLFSTGPKTQEDKVEDRTTPENEKVEVDTVTVKRKWYQRLFSTGPKNEAVKEERITSDTVIRSAPSSQDEKIITDTTTRKKKWYQKIFSTGPKDTVKRSTSATPATRQKETYYVQDATRQPAPVRDTVTITRRQPAAVRDTVTTTRRQSAPVRDTVTTTRRENTVRPATGRQIARDTVVSRRMASVDPASVKDTVELKKMLAESEQARLRNEEAMAQYRAQLKRSADSAAFYRNALVEAAEIQESAPAQTTRRSIFTNRRKQEEEARQREADEQASRDQYLYQQRYQTSQVNQLQQRIDELERDNRNLSRYQDNYNTEIRRRSVVDYGATTAVVAGAAISASDNREMASMREELNRLKTQVNSQDQRLKSVDSTVARDSAQNTIALIPRDTMTTVVPDTSRLNSLRSEIDLLREEVARLKAAPAAAPKAQPAEPAAADLRSFPVVSVYFNTGSVSLGADQAAKLLPFAQAAGTNKKAAILLKGFADATGNVAVNKKLANQRMEAVKNILLSKYNLSLYRISTDEPQISTGSGSKRANPLDRRVDLLFQ